MKYVFSLVVHWRFVSRIKDQMDKFMKGFCDLVPHSLITIFDENELEVKLLTPLIFRAVITLKVKQ